MRQPAIVREYHELLQAIDTRRRELGMPMIELDERAGLPLGYVGKLLTDPTKRNAKTLGRTSLGLVLKALGIEIVVVRSATVYERNVVSKRDVSPNELQVRMRKMATKGARTTNARLTPDQMTRKMRKVVRERWVKYRQARLKKRLKAERERQAPDAEA